MARMRRLLCRRRLHPALLLLLVLLGGSAAPASACTSLLFGRAASADGGVLLARSDDGSDAISDTNNLVWHPARDGPAVWRSNMNGLQVELPSPGLGFWSAPLFLANRSSGSNTSNESVGINSAGVAMSATESFNNRREAVKADPYCKDAGLREDAPLSLVLPRATSSRHAAELLGGMLSKYGAGEAFGGVLMADAREAWHLELGSGHHWLARRVPDDAFFVTGNQGRFKVVDLSDTANVLHSPGLLQFAASAGLWDPASGRPFSFFDAFMTNNKGDQVYSQPRVRELQRLLNGTDSKGVGPGCEPEFLLPRQPLSVLDAMAVLRRHFDGSEHDGYTNRDPLEPWRPVAVLRASQGHVVRLRPPGSLPDALSATVYIAMAMPALSPFVPIYKGLPPEALPPALAFRAGREADSISLVWKARRLQALVIQDWPRLAPNVTAALQEFEWEVVTILQPTLESRYAALHAAGDAAGAAAELAAFTHRVVDAAWALLDSLARRAALALGFRSGLPPDGALAGALDWQSRVWFPPRE
ncbi:hypothetical protein ABPG75_001642 [Micractinium tetrahymenae]